MKRSDFCSVVSTRWVWTVLDKITGLTGFSISLNSVNPVILSKNFSAAHRLYETDYH